MLQLRFSIFLFSNLCDSINYSFFPDFSNSTLGISVILQWTARSSLCSNCMKDGFRSRSRLAKAYKLYGFETFW